MTAPLHDGVWHDDDVQVCPACDSPDCDGDCEPATTETAAGDDEGKSEKKQKTSQATLIVRLAENAKIELWHDSQSDPYATIKVEKHREHHPLGSRAIEPPPPSRWGILAPRRLKPADAARSIEK